MPTVEMSIKQTRIMDLNKRCDITYESMDRAEIKKRHTCKLYDVADLADEFLQLEEIDDGIITKYGRRINV